MSFFYTLLLYENPFHSKSNDELIKWVASLILFSKIKWVVAWIALSMNNIENSGYSIHIVVGDIVCNINDLNLEYIPITLSFKNDFLKGECKNNSNCMVDNY